MGLQRLYGPHPRSYGSCPRSYGSRSDLFVGKVPTFTLIRNGGRKSSSLRKLTMVSSIEVVNLWYVLYRCLRAQSASFPGHESRCFLSSRSCWLHLTGSSAGLFFYFRWSLSGFSREVFVASDATISKASSDRCPTSTVALVNRFSYAWRVSSSFCLMRARYARFLRCLWPLKNYEANLALRSCQLAIKLAGSRYHHLRASPARVVSNNRQLMASEWP